MHIKHTQNTSEVYQIASNCKKLVKNEKQNRWYRTAILRRLLPLTWQFRRGSSGWWCWYARPVRCPAPLWSPGPSSVRRSSRTGVVPWRRAAAPCWTDQPRAWERWPARHAAEAPVPASERTSAAPASATSSPYRHRQTHTHPFNGPLSGTTQVSRYQKGKPIWILLKQETVSGSGISWAICKSAPHCRQITTPAPHCSVFYRPDALPAAQPTVSKHSRQSTHLEHLWGNLPWPSGLHLLLTYQHKLPYLYSNYRTVVSTSSIC